MGVNQERFTAVSHGEARSPAYYRRYRDMGFRNVRFFVPAGFEPWQVGLSSKASDIAGYLDAVQACVDSGMPVTHIDGTDVIGDWQLDGQGGNVSAANNYVRMFAEAVAKRNYPTDRVIVGACNEYGGTKGNGFWEPHRVRWNGYLRDALPNHTIVEGPSVWKDPRSLFDPNFVPWGNEPKQGNFNPWNDANSLIDCHHYMGWDAGGMNWIGEQVLAWCAANGRKMYMGEHGFDAADGNKAADVPNWIRRMDAESAYDNINRMKQCWWAVTDGSAWRMNAPGGNYLRDGLDVAVKRWAGRIDKSNGLA